MKKEEKKKMIAPALKKMKVGDFEEFEFSRFESVRITASRIQVAKRLEGWKFSIDTKGLAVRVTRIA